MTKPWYSTIFEIGKAFLTAGVIFIAAILLRDAYGMELWQALTVASLMLIAIFVGGKRA